MGAIRLFKKKLYVTAHSLLEVVVSTVIIVTAFLLFSMTMGQLTKSRRMVPETVLLMKTHSFRAPNGVIDTGCIVDAINQCNVAIANENIYSFPYQDVRIMDKNSGKAILKYFLLTDSIDANQLFEQ